MKVGIAALACAALGSVSVSAQDSRDWQHTLAVYLMAAGMDGTVGIGPVSADVNLDFSDLIDHLELGTMMAYAAERGPLTIGVDVIYMDLAASKDGPSGVRFDAEAKQAMVAVDAAYRLTERFEVLGGVRFTDVDSDIAVLLPGGQQLAGDSESWVDPYIGGRLSVPLAGRWAFTLRADVGGFGVGADSAWQLVSRFDWSASERLDVLVGYRILDVDYDDGEGLSRFRYDVRSAGPVVGVAWRY